MKKQNFNVNTRTGLPATGRSTGDRPVTGIPVPSLMQMSVSEIFDKVLEETDLIHFFKTASIYLLKIITRKESIFIAAIFLGHFRIIRFRLNNVL
jgi:hypothetical protein